MENTCPIGSGKTMHKSMEIPTKAEVMKLVYQKNARAFTSKEKKTSQNHVQWSHRFGVSGLSKNKQFHFVANAICFDCCWNMMKYVGLVLDLFLEGGGGVISLKHVLAKLFVIHDHPSYFSKTFTSYLVPLVFSYGSSHESWNWCSKKYLTVDIPFSSSHGVNEILESWGT